MKQPAPERRERGLTVEVVAGDTPLTDAELDAWADALIGYLLDSEGLSALPADPDDEAA